jgi:hypothetical protein
MEYWEPVRFAEKPWLKVLFADLLWEKNTVSAEKNKLKSTDYKTSEQDVDGKKKLIAQFGWKSRDESFKPN